MSIISEILPSNEAIDTNFLLQIVDINTLYKLYLTGKSRFGKLLNNVYVLNQLASNFHIKDEFKNFNGFLNAYREKIGPPKVYGVGEVSHFVIIDNTFNLRIGEIIMEEWAPNFRKCWLGKLYIVQKSDLVYHYINPNIDPTLLTNFIYESSDGTISWDTDYYYAIANQYYIPDKKLFYFIIDTYDQLTIRLIY